MGQEKSVSLSITITVINLIAVLISIQSVVVCLQFHHGIVTNDKSPRITVTQEHKPSSSLSKNPSFIAVNVTYSTNRSNTILGRSGDRFKFKCTAPYITRWKSSITPKSDAVYEHANRFSHNPLKPREDAIFVSRFSIILPTGKSGFVKCECASNQTLATGVYIYTLDGEDLTKTTSSELQPPIFKDTSQNFILPCNANYPNVTAKLGTTTDISSNSDFIEFDESLRVGDYDPQVGFVIRGRENTTGRVLRYVCAAGNQKLVFDVYNIKPGVDRNDTIQFDTGFGSRDEISVGVSCKIAGSIEPIQIQIIYCNSKFECDWLNDCAYTKCKNNGVAYLESKNAIVSSFIRGKLRCVSKGTIISEAYDYVFVGSKNRRQYLLSQFDDNQIPTDALIHINETEKILYSNKPVVFECSVTDFVYVMSNIKFAALFQNGTISLLDKVNSTSDPAIIKEGKVYGYTRKRILVNLTVDMIGIMCFAPLLESPEWGNTTWKFQVKDVRAPYIHYQPMARGSRNEIINSNPFYVGDTTRTLECNATGEPAPNIQWVVPKKVSHQFAHINKEEALLRFPTIDLSFQGQYTCKATNEHGSDTHTFDIVVQSPSLLFVIIPAITGGFFLLLAIEHIFFIWKYKRAKKKLGKLSAQEIADFKYGKQERPSCKREVQADLLQKESLSLSRFNSAFEYSTSDLSVTVHEPGYTSLQDEVDSRPTPGSDDYVPIQIVVRSDDEDFPSAIADDNQNVPEIITEDQVQSMCFNRDFEVKSSDLVIGSKIGGGNFGEVYLGSFKGGKVAVKTTKETADLEYVRALMSEIKIMQYIRTWSHPNIVQYLGAVISEIERGKLFVVVELSQQGSLKSVLENRKSYEQVKGELTVLNLVNWCEQIASGMEFLASKKVLHGDLAARNVLMFENDVVKITDFGLSKQLYDNKFYKKKMNKGGFPVPWLAIESLQHLKFSSQSDVWSFGVTAWEIFTLGQEPVLATYDQSYSETLCTGRRLGKPDLATDSIYAQLLKCWRLNPDKRPSFFSLKKFFRSTLESMRMNARSTLEAEASAQQNGNGTIPHYITMATICCDN